MTPQEYRLKHRRCRWCKYVRYIQPPHYICGDYYQCLVKDKPISDLFLQNRGVFCKVYKPKELNFEI